MKYKLKRNEERSICVICNKSFARKKGSRTKTCSRKCANRLASKTRKKRREGLYEL